MRADTGAYIAVPPFFLNEDAPAHTSTSSKTEVDLSFHPSWCPPSKNLHPPNVIYVAVAFPFLKRNLQAFFFVPSTEIYREWLLTLRTERRSFFRRLWQAVEKASAMHSANAREKDFQGCKPFPRHRRRFQDVTEMVSQGATHCSLRIAPPIPTLLYSDHQPLTACHFFP